MPAGPIYSIADIMQDEHYIARGMFENATLPDGTRVKLPTFAPKFNNTPGSTEWVGPPLGAHNNEIYCGLLERHMFVCTSGEYCPSKDGDSKEIHKTLKALVAKAGLKGKVRINKSGCLDQCGHGPMAVVYPEGVWYSHLSLKDVPLIVEEHLVKGHPVESLRYRPPKGTRNKLDRDANDHRIPGLTYPTFMRRAI